MNRFKRVYCRAYQKAFRIASPILPYRNPEILSSVNEVKPLLEKLNVTSVLLITDSQLRDTGVTKKLENSLGTSSVNCTIYDKTRPNPTVQNVEEAFGSYRKKSCQAIIAFGGGSSIDCAKAVGARVVYPNKSLEQLKGLLKVARKLPTLIAIPTTAGTGSEVTVTAVITDSEKKHKYTMNNFTFIPSYAVLDPEVTYTLPASLTATTGMDALTHAVEAYIGGSTNSETRRLSLEATKLVFENIEIVYKDGKNTVARKNMLLASHMAGIAFSKAYVGYIHAVAHSLGGQYNVPHGLANSVLMPIVLEEYGSKIYGKLRDLALAASVANENDSDEQAAKKFICAIKEMNLKMNIPEKLSGIKAEDIPMMAKHADKEANPLYPVPQLMNSSQLEGFYHKVADWSQTI